MRAVTFSESSANTFWNASMARFRDAFCCSGLVRFHFCPFIIGLAQLVDDLVILAENSKPRRSGSSSGLAVFEDAAKPRQWPCRENHFACPRVPFEPRRRSPGAGGSNLAARCSASRGVLPARLPWKHHPAPDSPASRRGRVPARARRLRGLRVSGPFPPRTLPSEKQARMP